MYIGISDTHTIVLRKKIFTQFPSLLVLFYIPFIKKSDTVCEFEINLRRKKTDRYLLKIRIKIFT